MSGRGRYLGRDVLFNSNSIFQILSEHTSYMSHQYNTVVSLNKEYTVNVHRISAAL